MGSSLHFSSLKLSFKTPGPVPCIETKKVSSKLLMQDCEQIYMCQLKVKRQYPKRKSSAVKLVKVSKPSLNHSTLFVILHTLFKKQRVKESLTYVAKVFLAVVDVLLQLLLNLVRLLMRSLLHGHDQTVLLFSKPFHPLDLLFKL